MDLSYFPWFVLTFAGIIGTCIGSFLNVIIYRLPLKQSIVFPASHCPNCNNKIHFYDNIPILSYLILKAKCRNCHAKISFRYCAIEIMTGLTFILIIFNNDYLLDLNLLKHIIFLCTGIIVAFIDGKHFIIPDVITLPLIVIGLVLGYFSGNIIDSLIGAFSGFVAFYAIALMYYFTKKEEGLGGGDIKYITAIGAFLGAIGTLFVMFLSSFIALFAYSLIYKKNNRKNSNDNSQTSAMPVIPYGVFLAIAGIFYLLFGELFTNWYLSFLY